MASNIIFDHVSYGITKIKSLIQDQCVSLHTTAQYGGHDYDDCHSPCHFTTIKMVVNVADFIQRHAHIVHTSTTSVAAG